MSTKTIKWVWVLISLTSVLLIITATCLLFFTTKDDWKKPDTRPLPKASAPEAAAPKAAADTAASASLPASPAPSDAASPAPLTSIQITVNPAQPPAADSRSQEASDALPPKAAPLSRDAQTPSTAAEDAAVPKQNPAAAPVNSADKQPLPTVKAIFVNAREKAESNAKLAQAGRNPAGKGAGASASSAKKPTPPPASALPSASTKAQPPVRTASASASASPNRPPQSQPATRFWIQLHSFASLSRAEAGQAQLKKEGIPTTLSVTEKDGKPFYRLRLGPFDTKAEAKAALRQLQSRPSFSDSYISQTTAQGKR